MKCDSDCFNQFTFLYFLNVGAVTAAAMIGYGLTSHANANKSSADAAAAMFAGGAAISGALTPLVGVLSKRFEATITAYFIVNFGGTAVFAKAFEDSNANYFQVAQEVVGFAFVAVVVAAICTLLSYAFKDPTYSFAELINHARENFPGQPIVIGQAVEDSPSGPVTGVVIGSTGNSLPDNRTENGVSITVEEDAEETTRRHHPF